MHYNNTSEYILEELVMYLTDYVDNITQYMQEELVKWLIYFLHISSKYRKEELVMWLVIGLVMRLVMGLANLLTPITPFMS